MRKAGREEPYVTLVHIGDIGMPGWVEDGDAARSVRHERPFRKDMPMQLAHTACRQPHVDARDGLRDLEVGLRYLPRPADYVLSHQPRPSPSETMRLMMNIKASS